MRKGNSHAEKMGRKNGSLFTAIKRIFSPKKKTDKNKAKGKSGHGENKSFIPLFTAASSIEKILVEADQLNIRPPVSLESPKTLGLTSQTPASSSPYPESHPLETNAEAPFSDPVPFSTQRRDEISGLTRSSSTAGDRHYFAVKIQAAYRGHLARRSVGASNGLERLQAVMRGPNVRRQTMNALKQIQLLVGVQRQIQSRRMQMPLHHDAESSLSKRTLNQLMSETGRNEGWDDSLLTKEEEEAWLHRKMEAVIKRERAMAYAYTHKLWKSNPRSSPVPLDWRWNGSPWWSNWYEWQLPAADIPISQCQNTAESSASTPLGASSVHPRCYRHSHVAPECPDSTTPRSSKISTMTPTRSSFPWPNSPNVTKKLSPANSAFGTPSFKDNASLMSSPAFGRPHYMTPTVSAMGKFRASSSPKERFSSTPDSNRRYSLPFNGSSIRDSASQAANESPRSVRSSALNSAVSTPAFVSRRKAFNRFA